MKRHLNETNNRPRRNLEYPAALAALKAGYDKGEAMRKIAAGLGVSPRTMCRVLHTKPEGHALLVSHRASAQLDRQPGELTPERILELWPGCRECLTDPCECPATEMVREAGAA